MTYAGDGYEVIPRLCPDALVSAIVLSALAHKDNPFIAMAHRILPSVLQTMRESVIVSKIKELIGEPVALNSEYFFGKPGTTGFNPHQDNAFIQAPALISCWIALTDVSEGNGCLFVYPGSHKLGRLPKAAVDLSNRVDPCILPPGDKIAVPMRKGDAILMHGELVHGSYTNASDRYRESLTIAYVPKGCAFNPGKYGRVPIEVT